MVSVIIESNGSGKQVYQTSYYMSGLKPLFIIDNKALNWHNRSLLQILSEHYLFLISLLSKVIYETYIPAKRYQTQAHPWFPCSHGN